jgi:hypothetical protein
MRSPSARVLVNTCTVYPYVPAQDADAGNDPAACYPASAGTFACSYQCQAVTRVDEAGRVSSGFTWAVLFSTADVVALGFKINDRVDLLNADSTLLKTVYADGGFDLAGRGSTTEVMCRETR